MTNITNMEEGNNILEIDFQYFPIVGLPMCINNYNITKSLGIENKSVENLENLTLELVPAEDFAQKFTTSISKINAGESTEILIKLDTIQSYILGLSEIRETYINLNIICNEQILISKQFPIKIVPVDFWTDNYLPELTASFVMPDLHDVKKIVERASQILKEYSGDGTLDGYLSRNVNRVRQMASAIFEALREQDIVFRPNPEIAESLKGQRIRFADEILTCKNGTGVETALLFASCLECAHLYPIVILIKGHAFVGLHLLPETFQDSVCDDMTVLTKRLQTGNKTIEVIESTMIDSGKNIDFETACRFGAQSLTTEKNFEYFVAVTRCRSFNIKPLPKILRLKDGSFAIQGDVLQNSQLSKPEDISIYDIPSVLQDNKPLTKQNIWERKLLDLSLRNSLLNMRFNKKNLLLISAGINKIEDYLSGGEEFRIFPRPSEIKIDDENIANANITVVPGSDLEKFILRDVDNKKLHSVYSESENIDALKALYRTSKSSLEENGANTLYMAIGLLKWFETPKSETPRFAPILLLPIDIIKRNSSSGYVIRCRDEEVIANVTLAEMLRQNYEVSLGLPDPLPTDESGVDVPLILDMVRKSIAHMSHWAVEEKVVIGNFCFNKFVMWNDIHSHAEILTNNKIVSSLISGKLTFSQNENSKTAGEMDKEYTPSQMLLPVSADSSQLEAVEEAVTDNSFIMFGPPGTGKSQTITNIIANALYRGKRVLFVAQKAAALEVVRTRLDKLGLSPFCLDVFSNKTNKSVVIEQLKNCVEVTRYKEPKDFASDAQKLMSLRNELNGMQESTHKPLPCGISLYEAINQYIAIGEEVESNIEIPLELVGTINKETKDIWFEIANECSVISQACGNPADNKLNSLNFKEFDADLKKNLTEITSGYIKDLSDLKTGLEDCNQWLKVTNHENIENLDNFENLILEIAQLKMMNEKAAIFSDKDGKQDQYFAAMEHGKYAAIKHGTLTGRYKESVFNKNWAEELDIWKKSENQFFISKWFTRRKIKKALKQYVSGSNEINPDSDLQDLTVYYEEIYKALSIPELNEIYEGIPCVTLENWHDREDLLKEVLKIDEMIKQLSANPFEYMNVKKNFSTLFSQGFKMYQDFYAKSFIETAKLINRDKANKQNLLNIGGVDIHAIDNKCESESIIEKRKSLVKTINENLDGLKEWFIYLTAKRKAASYSMSFATEFFDKTDIEPSKWVSTFKKSFYKAVAEYIFSVDDNAKLFKGEIFDDKVKRYRELNNKYTELAKAELYAVMASRAPNFSSEASKNSEPGILQKNIRSNGRGTSIRKIFDQIPNLLPRLCPCMLMSPMSVAQYLSLTDKPQFDITIFDEASQMPTSDAVGSIARSKNVIITGDPKQMPPTSFFSSVTTDEDNIEIEDLESILDDALALNFKSKNLLWHYRSKHESLITFSNNEYYDNSLLTFPSPDNRISKVTFHKIDGYYDKGKSRRNPAEAKAVVAEIEKLLSDPEMSKHSIGVVTFNLVQQQLIDDLLTDLFTKRPELETIATNSSEPLFVKNLENVQGDERDIILFSVGYGPDINGKVSMNFGPLNQKGGERRLNVAVSRARYEMKIFSTLTSEMIDTNRSSAKGVEGLKKFLAFAQNGTSHIRTLNNISENEIAKDIAKELKAAGYESDIHVGSSGFKIDVAVCDPKDKKRYVLAILIDTNDESRIKTARDREIIQPSVLNALGWNVMKVWSIDWHNDKKSVVSKIEKAIQNAGTPGQQSDVKPKIEIKMEVADIESEQNRANSIYSNPDIVKKENYVSMVCMPIPDQELNTGVFNHNLLKDRLEKIIEQEAPIFNTMLYKKVIELWKMPRITPTVAEEVDNMINKLGVKKVKENERFVIWKSNQNPEKYQVFRSDEKRDSSEIPLVEYENAVKYVLQTEMALPLEDLKKNASKQLGFGRMGTQVMNYIDLAINNLTEKGKIEERDGKYLLIS